MVMKGDGFDGRNFHILRYREVILAYTRFNVNFRLTKTAYLWPIKYALRTSLAVQWFRLCASTAGDVGSIPGLGTKILYATWHSQKKKKRKKEGKCIVHLI